MQPISILEEYLNNSQEKLRVRTYYVVYRILQLPDMTNTTFNPGELMCYAQKINAAELLRRLRGLPTELQNIYNDCVSRHLGNPDIYEKERRAIELLVRRLQ